MRLYSAFAAACVLSFAATTSAVAEYPDGPVTFIVPWGPGGSSDVGVRTWIPYMEKCIGKPITVVNKPGAGGILGFTEIASAKPDGYTLGAIHIPNMPVGAITGDATYKVSDFDILGNFYGSNSAISVRRDNPLFESIAQMIDYAKTSGKPIRMGIGSIGSDDYLAALRLAKISDVSVEFIPFGDTAATRNALAGGHVELISISAAETVPFKEQFLTLGVAAEQRYAALPEAPTFKEQGIDLVAGSYHVIGAPKGIPKEDHDKLATCFQSVAKDPAFVADVEKRAYLLTAMSDSEASKLMEEHTKVLEQIWKSDPWK